MSERLDNLNKNCPAMAYLRNVLRAATKASESNAQKIMVDDGEDQHFYPMNEAGVFDAARWALDVDGLVTIRVHRATFVVLYDGPYDRDNREEIICDGNQASSAIIASLDKDGRNIADGGIHRIL